MVRSMIIPAQGLFILFIFMCVWWRLALITPLVRYVQTSFVLLLLMWVSSTGVMVERFLRYRVAHSQSRTFLQQVVGALHNRDLDQAIAIAGRHNRSPIAEVVASGLASFQMALPLLSDADVIDIAKRALRRSTTVTHGQLRRSLNILASIASTAPMIGVLGALLAIIDSFKGGSMTPTMRLGLYARGLAEALSPVALSLLVGVPTTWCYKYLRSEVEAFDIEVEKESLELVIYLAIILPGSRSNYLPVAKTPPC